MSMTSDALHWIERRVPEAPDALRQRMAEAIRAVAERGQPEARGEGVEATRLESREERPELTEAVTAAEEAGAAGERPGQGAVAWRLAEAGVAGLRTVLEAPGEREAALDLLCADALLTHAMEAAAEAGPETLDAIARGFGPERLAQLLA